VVEMAIENLQRYKLLGTDQIWFSQEAEKYVLSSVNLLTPTGMRQNCLSSGMKSYLQVGAEIPDSF
jgi:hypothetical protein